MCRSSPPLFDNGLSALVAHSLLACDPSIAAMLVNSTYIPRASMHIAQHIKNQQDTKRKWRPGFRADSLRRADKVVI
eukprot:4517606-Amphidinium_carterae.1